MAPIARQSYEKDEKCWCFHGAFLYEAKILDVEQEDPKDKRSPFKYRVHYKGWKNTWDDWVDEERLKKFTDENRELAENLLRDLKRQQREERQAKEAQKKSSSSHKKKPRLGSDRAGRGSEERSSSVAAGRGTKRNRDWDLEKEDDFIIKPSVRVVMPDSIKSILVDDWENVTKNLHLVPLPHKHPVTEILDTYKDQEMPKRHPGSAEADILEEIIGGVRLYFDKCLGRILLYRFERPQYLEVLEHMAIPVDMVTNGSADSDKKGNFAGKTLAEVYGAEHLCRLLVSMPELVAQTNMDPQSITKLRNELLKLSQWLSKHAPTYFVQEYTDPGQEYVLFGDNYYLWKWGGAISRITVNKKRPRPEDVDEPTENENEASSSRGDRVLRKTKKRKLND